MEVFLQSLPIERLCGFPFPPETDTSTPPPQTQTKQMGNAIVSLLTDVTWGGGGDAVWEKNRIVVTYPHSTI